MVKMRLIFFFIKFIYFNSIEHNTIITRFNVNFVKILNQNKLHLYRLVQKFFIIHNWQVRE
jgi:hypothetical protein